MRVVLDTNVLVSAFVFTGGPPEDVLRLAMLGRVQLITSTPLLAELGRVLGAKFGWEPARTEAAISQLLGLAEVVEPGESVDDVKEDPSDNRVLEAALAGDAEVIVSGDHHLLDLEIWRGVRVQDPAAFLSRKEFE